MADPAAQYDAVCSWGVPNHALLQRVSAIEHPVFLANGDSDPMILPHYSYLLAGLIPQANVKIYPDSAHGFLFQHAAEFAADVEEFLSVVPKPWVRLVSNLFRTSDLSMLVKLTPKEAREVAERLVSTANDAESP